MRKKLFVFFIFICFLAAFINVNAWAGPNGGPNSCKAGEVWSQGKCVGTGGGDTDIKNTNTNFNTAFGGKGGQGGTGIGIGIGKGGDGGNAKAYGGDAAVNIGNGMFNKTLSPEANAKASAGASAIGFFDVDNEIDMDQKQSQKQKQSQSSLNMQGQVGINKNDNSNKGNKQTTKVVVEGDTITYKEQYNHINPVSGPDTDSQTVKSKGHDALTKGSIMDKVDGLSIASIKRAAKGAKDVEIIDSVFFEPKDSVNFVRVGNDGEFSGYLYATCDDVICPAAGMEAKAMEKAATLGFTHISRMYESSGEYLLASEWSLKLGGGASVGASGGNTMIAPGGGIGGGAAESSTVMLPAMTFEVFYNPLYIKEVK